ncbi:TonB-dependent receptor [Sphingobium yanoikuyae]|uniref:TonB-dependent receptor n=1 Tax=Sphingobium yanoikuyae TaxID=13690 RepID=UPI002410064A|nr:TonB-dependent receptor [Sphingobium yanoikuyae]MDG2515700.1 TonB-dependent receptor [Sphingobium yanoikuyae]
MTYTRTLAFLLSSCAIAPAALAQTTSSQSPQGVSEASPPSEDAVDDIIVTGIRRSLSTANDVKRDAPYIVDAIAAEDLGKFPDQNVAESLQRITGVAITRTVGGEGQSVSVRGLGPQFNVTTVNGRVLATSNGGRDFSFDVLPSEVISGAQVYKTTMASLEEGSIGGTVNMSTARPLARPGFHAAFSAGGLYDEISESLTPQASGFISQTFADDTIGVLIGGAYTKRNIRSDFSSSISRGQVDFDANGDGAIAGDGSERFAFPNITAFGIRQTKRERIGATGALQWKPDDSLEMTLDGLYSYYSTPETTYQQNNNFTTNLGSLHNVGITNGAITSFDIDNVAYEVATNPTFRKVKTWQAGYNIKWRPTDRLSLTGDAAYSQASSDQGGKNRFYVAGIPGANIRYEAGSKIPTTVITLPSLTPGGPRRDASEFTPGEVSPSFAQVNGSDISDKVFQARLDGEWKFDGGVLSSLTFGAEYVSRIKDNRAFDTANACAFCGFPFSFGQTGVDVLNSFPGGSFMGGKAGDFPHVWPAVDVDKFLAAVQAAEGRLVNPSTGQVYPVGYTADQLRAVFLPRNSSKIDEKSYAGYVQANFETGALSGNVGVRVIHTELTSSGATQELLSLTPIPNTSNFNAVFSDVLPVSETGKYTKALPSLNLTYKLEENLLLRAAASKSIARPNINQLGVNVNYEVNSTPPSLTEAGNAALKPIRSTNLDASIEYYPTRSSILSLGVFYKDIKGFVSPVTVTETIAGYAMQVTRPVNGDDAYILGVEGNVSYLFDNGLGFQLNGTLNKSKADYSSTLAGRVTTLEGLSKYSFNAVALYEKHGISARLAYSYRRKYVSASIGQASDPEYTDGQGFLDGSISYDLTPNYTVYVQGQNLLKEDVFTYSVDKYRPIYYERIARRVEFGVRARF